MKIALSGGNGRIGKAVIELALDQGHTIVNIDRVPPDIEQSNVSYQQADATDFDSFVKALDGCEALIHLAAIAAPGHHPDHVVHNNNTVSSYNALRGAVEVGITRVCQASSINAIGGAYSRWPRYDYFPVDEHHPTYNEDPYSLSKWICERQADSMVRRFESLTVASLRIHGVVANRPETRRWESISNNIVAKHLWGYTLREAAALACLLGITADFSGHESFYIVAPNTMMETPSLELKEKHFPKVPVTGDLSENRGFFNCEKAERLLGWHHQP
ncbi:MAG: NAD(P)-dependent oxidoreductase [Ardenticatenaceae bacterium]|nr:NAD(P)-dependent oxidoreductase [Ardenticatenaceae bacterium]